MYKPFTSQTFYRFNYSELIHNNTSDNAALLTLFLEKDPNFNMTTIPNWIVSPYAQHYNGTELLMTKYAHLIPLHDSKIVSDFVSNMRWGVESQQAFRILEQLLKMKLPIDHDKVKAVMTDKYVSEMLKKNLRQMLIRYGYKV